MKTFETWLEEQQLAKKTIDLYAGCVKKALECESIQDPLFDAKLGKSRKETYHRALKKYAEFIEDEKLAAFLADWKPEKTKRGQKAKRKKGAPRALGLDTEWVALRQSILTITEIPLRTTLFLLATSGLRISEVLMLTGENLRTAIKLGSVLISGKGDVERYFILASDEQRLIVAEMAGLLKDAETILAKLYTKRRASFKGVEAMIKRELTSVAATAGIERPEELHPHMLRRTVGDAIYRATKGDIRAVQEALGHKDWKTTWSHYQDHAHLEETTAAYERALKGKG